MVFANRADDPDFTLEEDENVPTTEADIAAGEFHETIKVVRRVGKKIHG